MAYFDNYGSSRSKIPYDDIPITRNERSSRGSVRSAGSPRMSKFSTFIISFMIVLNLVLSVVCIYFIKNTKNRTIYNNEIILSSSSEVASAVKTSALLSTVGVAAGDRCNSVNDFYNSMDSRGAGVVYSVERESSNKESAAYNRGTIYFVTCYHVVSGYVNLRNQESVWVMLPTALKPKPVWVVAYSAHYDLAVLRIKTNDIEGELGGCTPVKVFDSVYTSLGEKIYAIGNPLSTGLSITEGIVSRVNAEIKISTNSYSSRTIQISAEINPGNSGGGLFNSKGEFLGIVNAKRHSATSDNQSFTVVGMSYAIPSSLVVGIADKLIAGNTKPTRVNLGVTFEHDNSMGVCFPSDIEYGGEHRFVEKYGVVIDNVRLGSVGYNKLKAHEGDVVEAIEVKLEGVSEPVKVPMLNKYIFEDYAFRIEEGSKMKIYFADGNFEEITLSSVVTDFD